MINNGILPNVETEVEHLRQRAQAWEAETGFLLDRIGVGPGWRCIDLACGPLGILGALSARVGPRGQVMGVDTDPLQLEAARRFTFDNHLDNVLVAARDAFQTGLQSGIFDLVHARFVLAMLGRPSELLREMLLLARSGGVIAFQEPIASSWSCYPAVPAWERLVDVLRQVYGRGGGDLDAGQRTYALLRGADLADVQVRGAVQVSADGGPLRQAILQNSSILRRRILEAGILPTAEMEALLAECRAAAANPDTLVVSYILTQVWGRKR